MSQSQHPPDFFLSLPHECSYLPEQDATTLFLDPSVQLESDQYARFLQKGFRRSGDLVYRPYCSNCKSCIPVRVPVDRFKPNRSQRRTWSKNQDLNIIELEAEFNKEHFALYELYQNTRHRGGGMDQPSPGKYMEFLVSRQTKTRFVEFRLEQELIAVAVMDVLPDSLSAVYTFFDPKHSARSLGVFAVIWEIKQALSRGLSWVYLGYWINQCQKMSYKAQYQPLEAFQNGCWELLESD